MVRLRPFHRDGFGDSVQSMSYDLVFWKGKPPLEPGAIWARLAAEEPVEGLAPFARDEVTKAFRAVFGKAMKVGDPPGTILGRGFELRVADGDKYLHVCCAWGLLESEEGRAVLARIGRVGENLGATQFDPQLAEATEEEGRAPVQGDLGDLGPARTIVHGTPGEDRAQSFGTVEAWSVPAGNGSAIHALFLASAGESMSARHAYHPSRLAEVTCEYVRLVQGVLPFELVVACGGGRAADGCKVRFANRVLAAVGGKVGFIGPSASTLAKEDGRSVSLWTGVRLTAPRAAAVDLTEVVVEAARKALAEAHVGRTRPLRDWLVLMVSIDSAGLAAEELLGAEVPGGGDVATGFEVFDSGAVMPVWSQRAAGVCTVEARLRLPEHGGFALKILNLGFGAAQRHTLPPPLGPS